VVLIENVESNINIVRAAPRALNIGCNVLGSRLFEKNWMGDQPETYEAGEVTGTCIDRAFAAQWLLQSDYALYDSQPVRNNRCASKPRYELLEGSIARG
jgi:hypothetical protein